jgi:hypothetical protein
VQNHLIQGQQLFDVNQFESIRKVVHQNKLVGLIVQKQMTLRIKKPEKINGSDESYI